jgi:hypothetical protein
MELTKEYFDETLKGLATKADLKGLVTNSHLEQTLAATEKRIITRIDDAQEELARIVADTVATPFTERFERLEELLRVKSDVDMLKQQMSEIRSALHLAA